jgi:hypothetical protein
MDENQGWRFFVEACRAVNPNGNLVTISGVSGFEVISYKTIRGCHSLCFLNTEEIW